MIKDIYYLFIAEGFARQIVCPSAKEDFANINLIEESINVIHSVDERSAGYLATGMSDEIGEPVVIWVKNNASFRNLTSSLTEAFYRKIPLIIVAIPSETPINQKVNPYDILVGSINVNENDNLDRIIAKIKHTWDQRNGPVLIDLQYKLPTSYTTYKLPSSLLTKIPIDAYLIIDPLFSLQELNVTNRNIYKLNPISYEGGISTLIGISVAANIDKTIGIFTDAEILCELNMLGNRNVKDNTIIIVYCTDRLRIETLRNFVHILGWIFTFVCKEDDIEIFDNQEAPTLIIINKLLHHE